MKKRIITGLVLSIILIGIYLLNYYVNKIFYDLFIVVIMVSSAFELSSALANHYSKANNFIIFFNCLLGYLVYNWVVNTNHNVIIAIISFVFVCVLSFLALIIFNILYKKMELNEIFSTILIFIYPQMFIVCLLSLNYFGNNDLCNLAILLTAVITCFTDIFAYFVGSFIKGAKLIPSISPNKTISGAIGGLIGGIIGAIVVYLIGLTGAFHNVVYLNNKNVAILIYIFVGFICSVFAQIGDLIASYLKRVCKIKDFGSILPGHGGILDRIDSLIICSFLMFIFMLYFNSVAFV